MTMSNQMSLSAASVAVMANNNTLVNMGAMQNADYLLDGSTINAGLEATNKQATAEKNSITDQADATRINAGCQMGGAVVGLVVTGTGFGMGTADQNQATALSEQNQMIEASATQIPDTEMRTMSSSSSTSPASATNGTPLTTFTGEIEDDIPQAAPVGRLEGQLDTSVVPEDDAQASTARQQLQQDNDAQADAADQTKKAQTKADQDKQNTIENLRNSAKFKLETGNAFGSMLNTAIGNSGGFASYDKTIDQANQTQIKDLEAGLASALNSQASLISSQLGNLDSMRGNTYQLMSTLQHIQG